MYIGGYFLKGEKGPKCEANLLSVMSRSWKRGDASPLPVTSFGCVLGSAEEYIIFIAYGMERRRVALNSADMCKVITERQRNTRRVLERKKFLKLPLL